MSKEAMKLALEALQECRRDPRLKYEHPTYDKAIKALEEALAKQEQGEPVGAVDKDEFGLVGVVDASKVQVGDKLYTTPQQRTWVGLTDEDDIDWDGTGNLKQLVEAVEAKLNEKNT